MLCLIAPSLIAALLSISCFAAEKTSVSKDFTDPFLGQTVESNRLQQVELNMPEQTEEPVFYTNT